MIALIARTAVVPARKIPAIAEIARVTAIIAAELGPLIRAGRSGRIDGWPGVGQGSGSIAGRGGRSLSRVFRRYRR